jgi:hypothetical protein
MDSLADRATIAGPLIDPYRDYAPGSVPFASNRNRTSIVVRK